VLGLIWAASVSFVIVGFSCSFNIPIPYRCWVWSGRPPFISQSLIGAGSGLGGARLPAARRAASAAARAAAADGPVARVRRGLSDRERHGVLLRGWRRTDGTLGDGAAQEGICVRAGRTGRGRRADCEFVRERGGLVQHLPRHLRR